jgi:hypothetical protein
MPQPARPATAAAASKTLKQCDRTDTHLSPKAAWNANLPRTCGKLCGEHAFGSRPGIQALHKCHIYIRTPSAVSVKVKITREDRSLTEFPKNGRTVSM